MPRHGPPQEYPTLSFIELPWMYRLIFLFKFGRFGPLLLHIFPLALSVFYLHIRIMNLLVRLLVSHRSLSLCGFILLIFLLVFKVRSSHLTYFEVCLFPFLSLQIFCWAPLVNFAFELLYLSIPEFLLGFFFLISIFYLSILLGKKLFPDFFSSIHMV